LAQQGTTTTFSHSVNVPSEELWSKVFAETDQMWLESAAKSPRAIEQDGSTALCVVLEGNELMVANCGDCRAIMSQCGGLIQQITRDHRPTDEEEEQRIVLQGGTVIGGRLQGQLGVSRAFGNYEFKESNILSSDPEIHQISLTSDVEFLIIGSDGLYEHFSNEEIISFLKTELMNNNSNNNSLENVVKELVSEAIDRGSEDNITIIVVKFEKAFKKLLKKRAKKQAGKSSPSLLSGKSSPLRTSGKIAKHSSPDSSPPPEPKSIGGGLFKKGLKDLRSSGKSSLSPNSSSCSSCNSKDGKSENHLTENPSPSPSTPKKKSISKKSSAILHFKPLQQERNMAAAAFDSINEEKWTTVFSKPFTSFGRTQAVTISG